MDTTKWYTRGKIVVDGKDITRRVKRIRIKK